VFFLRGSVVDYVGHSLAVTGSEVFFRSADTSVTVWFVSLADLKKTPEPFAVCALHFPPAEKP
jgi:hypothetical protein